EVQAGFRRAHSKVVTTMSDANVTLPTFTVGEKTLTRPASPLRRPAWVGALPRLRTPSQFSPDPSLPPARASPAPGPSGSPLPPGAEHNSKTRSPGRMRSYDTIRPGGERLGIFGGDNT